MSLTRTTVLFVALMSSTAALADPTWTGLSSKPSLAGALEGRSTTFTPPAPRETAPLGSPRQGSSQVSSQASSQAPAIPAGFGQGLAARRTDAQKAPPPVDESALRYYASQNDTARVAAEIRRLKSIHASWEPPQDLFETNSNPERERELWDLFREGRLDDIRATVAAIQETSPDWRPSADLVTKFEQAEARQALVSASQAGDHARVIAFVEERPSLLACSEMDVLWRVAEALAATRAEERAYELYRFILTRCPNPQERLATVQKAAANLSLPLTERLIASGARAGESSNPYEAVRLDLFRKRIGEAIGSTSISLNADELRNFEALVEKGRSSSDAVLLGWYRYSLKDWSGAAQWFKLALGWERLPKAIEGHALALRQQGNLTEAERISYEARKSDPLIEKLYIEIVATDLTKQPLQTVEAERVERFNQVVAEARSVVGSQALGWYHYNMGRTAQAEEWFARSVSYEPTEANVLGLALAANKLKKTAAFRTIVAEYGPRFPAVGGLKRLNQTIARAVPAPKAGQGKKRAAPGSDLAGQAVALYKSGQYAAALATLDQRANRGAGEDDGLKLVRGWSLYHMYKYDAAQKHFAEMDARRSTPETQEGKRHATNQALAERFGHGN
jgi:tetratricopeptide (TPR) repeat protein